MPWPNAAITSSSWVSSGEAMTRPSRSLVIAATPRASVVGCSADGVAQGAGRGLAHIGDRDDLDIGQGGQ